MNAYIERVIEQVKRRDAHEPEFIYRKRSRTAPRI